ncbi:MAG: ATP-dependent RecD-like DNA helicase [Anaerolineales bacterium]
MPSIPLPLNSSPLSPGASDAPVAGRYAVVRVTFSNPDTGYAVVVLTPADVPDGPEIVAVGDFGAPAEGEVYDLQGVWKDDPRYGRQVRVEAATPAMPSSLVAIERYLAGSSIDGLGPVYARRLVEHFGAETLQVLDEGGQRLQEVRGIGRVRARLIAQSWERLRGSHAVMIALQGVAGLTPRQATAVVQQLGAQAWTVVSQNPYALAETVRGFGFKTCDRIARELGIASDSPFRLQAALVHQVKEELRDGHTWVGQSALIEATAAMTAVPAEVVAPQLDTLTAEGRLAQEDAAAEPAYALPDVQRTERRIADRLAWLLAQTPTRGLGLAPQAAEALVQRQAGNLTGEQRAAIEALLMGKRLVVLTGGPGTGKTTTMRALIDCLTERHVSLALCATTGRAAQQLAAATGHSAATVHRHLRIGVGDARTEPAPVAEQVLVIDESSMIDLWLMDEILRRLGPTTHLFLVGDVDQLPSVGPGAVLQDLIAVYEHDQHPAAAVVRLSQIFRQEAGADSVIVTNCHRVRAGLRPIADVPPPADYFEMHRDSPEEARDLAIALAAERLPRYLGIPPSEVQVLTPMHGGPAGVEALNAALQQALNPADKRRAELTLARGRQDEAPRVLRVGDKVRQMRNDYAKQVYNGDLGEIVAIDRQQRELAVQFDQVTAVYGWDELDELSHAWAMTIHSAQGSQWPAVVVLMLTNHFIMLERNILYTALSRAQRMAVMITQERAIRVAVSNARSTERRTALRRYLDEAGR